MPSGSSFAFTQPIVLPFGLGGSEPSSSCAQLVEVRLNRAQVSKCLTYARRHATPTLAQNLLLLFAMTLLITMTITSDLGPWPECVLCCVCAVIRAGYTPTHTKTNAFSFGSRTYFKRLDQLQAWFVCMNSVIFETARVRDIKLGRQLTFLQPKQYEC